MLFVEGLQGLGYNFDKLISSDGWILLGSGVLLKDFKCINILLGEEPLGQWSVNSNEDVLKASVIDVLIQGEKNIVQDLLLGHDCIIKIVDNMHDEEMCYFISNHLFEWLLNGFDHKLTILGIQDIEEGTGYLKTLLGG